MNSFSLTILIFTAVTFLHCLTSTGAATCHPDDEAGLLAFKAGITRDPIGILRDWEKGGECCHWMGVICITGDRVTELRLSGGETVLGKGTFYGTISPSLVKLQHLEAVSFTYLKLTGSFPQFLFRLPKLKLIRISGTLISGPIPVNIGALSYVGDITLDNNRFTGPIPVSISNLTRLTWLSLEGNRLSGTIPDVFKSMTELGALILSRNGFSGELPPSFASLARKLVLLDLSQNNLSGTIPDYFSRFKALSTFDLSRNHYSGVVPMSFTNLKSLFHVNFSRNHLTGPFPALNFVGGIGYLDLSYNQFHLNTIPEWITSSSIIYNLNLAKCGIKMRFEDWKPMKTESFSTIDLSENEISGSPARFLNKAEILYEFKASGNKLRFDLGKLNFSQSLRVLDLSKNLVFGKVPAVVAGLESLNLSQNHLCGKLPVTKFPAAVFAGNDCLCGSPLSPCKPLAAMKVSI